MIAEATLAVLLRHQALRAFHASMWASSPQVICLREAESTNGKLSSNLYGFEQQTWTQTTGLTGSPGSYRWAIQTDAAYELWCQRGWQPWEADYGKCGLG